MIIAVIVTFHPELNHLDKLINELKSQVDQIVVVDNGSGNEFLEHTKIQSALPENVKVKILYLGENFGIAIAQNKGIEWARSQNAKYVILFDQDSLPHKGMVTKLEGAAEEMRASGCKVASVGPRYVDDRQDNPPPFIRVSGLHQIRCQCENADSIVEVDYLIASGCLIPLDSLNVVGFMKDELFIDFVDIEWGLRAKSKGFQNFGVCSAIMNHSLGGEPINIFGRKIASHSPLRHYYHFRNAIWLCRQSWLPINWKIVSIKGLVLKFVVYGTLPKPSWSQFKMMLLGIWHGLTGKMGKLIENTYA